MRIETILQNVPYVATDVRVSWTDMEQSSYEPDKFAKLRAADLVAHNIAGSMIKKSTWAVTDEPEGRVFRVRGYWHSYDELLKLLETAYTQGRMDAL